MRAAIGASSPLGSSSSPRLDSSMKGVSTLRNTTGLGDSSWYRTRQDAKKSDMSYSRHFMGTRPLEPPAFPREEPPPRGVFGSV